MEPLPSGQARAARLAVVGVALLLLLGVVAFASRSGFGHTSQARPTPTYVSWAMSIFLIVFVLMIPFAVWAYGVQMREFRAQQKQKSLQSRMLRGLLIVGVIGAAFLIRLLIGHRLSGLGIHRPAFTSPPTAGRGKLHGAAKPYDPTFQWPVLWVTLFLLVPALGFVWWRLRHREELPPLDRADQTVAEDVAATIADAIEGLEAEPDPRRAVIAAYARMEAVLARHGLRRRPSETPIEYLRRVLGELTSRTEAVSRLTGLFELAKFSSHEIDGAMKEDAIAALRAIRDDLQGMPA